ncbi:hypothetical protein KDA14_01325 [Candidatus Saccharibacteria bacterium]|nr:hypothetical protein [Candidatus Saccharibacteria bacterium]
MTQIAPGLYETLALPNADNRLLTPFTTTSWAGMDKLFASIDDQHTVFPYFADQLAGYLPDAPSDHSLRRVETVLSGDFGTQSRLGLLTFQVGQIVHREPSRQAQQWERKYIREIIDRKPPLHYDGPRKSWDHEDYAALYAEIREEGAARLEAEVRTLAGAIALQNGDVQLYVERENGLAEGTGWLGPLLGLAIDRNVEDDHTRQSHDVIAVVGQTDGSEALLRGARASVYTIATRESIL